MNFGTYPLENPASTRDYIHCSFFLFYLQRLQQVVLLLCFIYKIFYFTISLVSSLCGKKAFYKYSFHYILKSDNVFDEI